MTDCGQIAIQDVGRPGLPPIKMCIDCLRDAQRSYRKKIMELRLDLHRAEAEYKDLIREIELT